MKVQHPGIKDENLQQLELALEKRALP